MRSFQLTNLLVLVLFAIGMLGCTNSHPQSLQQTVWEGTQDFNSNWLFLALDGTTPPAVPEARWQRVNLPHTWNAQDTLHAKPAYRRVTSWYRRHLQINADDLKRRLYLRLLVR